MPIWLAVTVSVIIVLVALDFSPKIGGLLLLLIVFVLLTIGLRRGTIQRTN